MFIKILILKIYFFYLRINIYLFCRTKFFPKINKILDSYLNNSILTFDNFRLLNSSIGRNFVKGIIVCRIRISTIADLCVLYSIFQILSLLLERLKEE